MAKALEPRPQKLTNTVVFYVVVTTREHWFMALQIRGRDSLNGSKCNKSLVGVWRFWELLSLLDRNTVRITRRTTTTRLLSQYSEGIIYRRESG